MFGDSWVVSLQIFGRCLMRNNGATIKLTDVKILAMNDFQTKVNWSFDSLVSLLYRMQKCMCVCMCVRHSLTISVTSRYTSSDDIPW